MKVLIRALMAIAGLLVSVATAAAQQETPKVSLPGGCAIGATYQHDDPDPAVRAALTRFLTAFENLDWDVFRASFDDDATAFFPTPEPPQRFEGRAAVATFQLRNEQRLARRTILFKRTAGGWRIAHLHASNVSSALTLPAEAGDQPPPARVRERRERRRVARRDRAAVAVRGRRAGAAANRPRPRMMKL